MVAIQCVEQLLRLGIKLKQYTNGNHKTLCPKCSSTRKNKKDPCLSVKIDDTGFVFNCHNCDFKGGNKNAEILSGIIGSQGNKRRDAATIWRDRLRKTWF